MEKSVFISYSHQDRQICQQVAGYLEGEDGVRVWYDKGLIPGEEYRKKIATVIREAEFFIVLLSERSVSSEWVKDEVEYAKRCHKKIIPIYIAHTELPDDLDMILQRYHSLFWYLRSSDGQFRQSLLSTVLGTSEAEGDPSVGNGNDFSEQGNCRMRELLQLEGQGVWSQCYSRENACLLGKAYLFGGPCAVDRQKARSYFRIAEYMGDPDGTFYLLQMRLEDRELDTWDEPEPEFCAPIMARIQTLARDGSLPAKLFMGDAYWYGKYGVPVDLVESARLYEECARAGNARGQYMMAANYYFGDGVPQDYVIAIMYADLAIEQRYLKGWRRWGKFYRDGLAVPQDYGKARECYEKGARMGDLNCYNKVGDMLCFGWGFPVDHEEAVRFYRLAEQAPVRGQRYALRKAKEALGRCYENGHGVEKDLELAAQKYLEGYRYGSQECKAGYLRCKSLTETQEK